MVRKVARLGIKHVLRSDTKSAPYWLRWGMARAQGAARRRRLVRATAVVWPESGRAIAIGRDMAKPGRGQVLIRTTASAVSPGTERAFFLRLPNTTPTFPSFPGYSLVGEVVSSSKELPFSEGDLVAAAASHASLAVVDGNQVHPVPAGMPAEEASFMQLGVIAVNALEQGRIADGDSVVVLGQGIIGQLLVQLAAAAGASSVVSVARTDRRVSDALSGASQIIVLNRDGAESLDELSASVVFDATGHPDAIPLALRAVGRGGTIVVAGSPRAPTEDTDLGAMADKEVTLQGAHAGRLLQPANADARAEAARCVETFFRLAADGKLNLEPMISARVHPWEADRFYRHLAQSDDATITAVFCWERLTAKDRMKRVSYLSAPDLDPITGARKMRVPS